MEYTARLEQYPYIFKSGESLIDMEVVIGQGDSSSSCSIKIADPGHKHAEALIDHSLKNGGIKPVEKPNQPVASPGGSGVVPAAGVVGGSGNAGIALVAEAKELTEKSPRDAWINCLVKTALANGISDNGQIAYLLATAELECSMGADLIEDWDGKGLQATYQNHPHLGNKQPGDGYRYRGRGFSQMTGRGVYEKIGKLMGFDYVNNPDLAARGDHALAIYINGVKGSWFTGSPPLRHYIEGSKQDVYNARRVINGIVPAQVAKLQSFYAKFYPQVESLKARAGGASVPIPKTEPGAVLPPATEVLKGNKITCTIGDQEYLFYHTGTSTEESGITVITGQTARWEMNKRERNAMRKDVSLSQVFKEVTASKGIKAEYHASFDPKYSSLPQVGISDHQLLLREASKAGLFIGNTNDGTITIKDLPTGLQDTPLVLAPGLNLIKYKITDKALDQSAVEDDAGSSLSQTEAKAVVEPASGQVAAVQRDVDKSPTSTTGKPVPKPAGQMQPQDQPVAQAAAARVKRLKGLPSEFTVPLQIAYQLQPLNAIRTTNLIGVLSRAWVVDKVKLSCASGQAVISAYSPIEVIDATPAAIATPGAADVQQPLPPGQGYIWPCSGTISSYAHQIRSVGTSPHIGTDIVNNVGTPIKASNDGVVSGYSGAGICVNIKHPDGVTTRYMHMIRRAEGMNIGVQVKRGQVVGYLGATGKVTGAHVHFDIKGAPNPKSTGYNTPDAIGLPYVKTGASVS